MTSSPDRSSRRSARGRMPLSASRRFDPRRPLQRHNWKRRLLFRVLAVAISLLIFLPVAEAVLRVWLTVHYRGSLEHLPTGLPDDFKREVRLGDLIRLDPDPAVGYRLRPGARARYRSVRVETNAEGFRDDAIATKSADTLRLVGLGDSSMFGFNIPHRQIYLEVVEAEFRALLDGRTKVEFVNAAVPGYNAVQQVALFRASGLALEPDAVVVQFDINDFQAPIGSVKPDFLFARYLFLAHPVRLWRGELSDADAFYLLDQVDRLYDTQNPYGGRKALEDAYRQLAALCHERNIPVFGVFLYTLHPPFGDETDPESESAYRRVRDLWREIGIRPIETFPNAKAHLLKRHQYSWLPLVSGPSDPHPNVVGHGLIAQAILPPLSRELLRRLEIDPAALPRHDALGNIALRQISGVGLYETENWDGLSVNWTLAFAHFQFIPAGRKLIVPMMIGHPDVSPQAPVHVHVRIDGVPTAAHPIGRVEHDYAAFQPGYVTRTIDLGDLEGNPLDFTITVSRTFHTATDPRSLGVALYSLGFED